MIPQLTRVHIQFKVSQIQMAVHAADCIRQLEASSIWNSASRRSSDLKEVLIKMEEYEISVLIAKDEEDGLLIVVGIVFKSVLVQESLQLQKPMFHV